MPKKYTNKQFVSKVFNMVKNEYTFKEKYINSKTKILCKHNKCGHKWKISPNNFFAGKGCPECFGTKKKTDKQFKKEVKEQVGAAYVFLEKYINNKTKLLCRHNECGYEWKINPDHFLNHKNRCPKCAGNLHKKNKQFKKEVYNQVKNSYVFLEKYINNETPILCRHNKCGYEWKIKPNNFLSQKNRCPNCNNLSHGERKIKKYLKEKNIKFKMEYKFSDLRTKNHLRFDFAIISNGKIKFLIEFDGKHHFNPNVFFGGTIAFRTGKFRDRVKTAYCYNNEIPLLRISYFREHLLEELIEEKLNNAM